MISLIPLLALNRAKFTLTLQLLFFLCFFACSLPRSLVLTSSLDSSRLSLLSLARKSRLEDALKCEAWLFPGKANPGITKSSNVGPLSCEGAVVSLAVGGNIDPDSMGETEQSLGGRLVRLGFSYK